MTPTLLVMAALALGPSADPYPNAKILIEPDALIAQLKADSSKTAVLDARDEKLYAAGHIPGAVRLPVADWGKQVPDTPETWAKRLAEIGVRAETPVVVYGGADVRDSARAWWLLKYAGAENVRLLNGGYPAWEKAGGATETKTNVARPIETGKPTVNPELLAEKKDVLAVVKDKSAQIIDTRSNDEFCGASNTAKRNGHIPVLLRSSGPSCSAPTRSSSRPRSCRSCSRRRRSTSTSRRLRIASRVDERPWSRSDWN